MSRQNPDQAYTSFAKINLFLFVTSRRRDGYHNLYSLMTRISLNDDLYLDFCADHFCVRCDYPGVPEDDSNLAVKAAKLFFQKMPSTRRPSKYGLSIRIVKRIPPGGGLGGGSSNAATVLSALNAYYGMPFSEQELMQMGLGLGADVPFFIHKGPAIAKGVGEQLEKVSGLVPYHLVLCTPPVHASTAQVFKNIDLRLTQNQKYTIDTGLNVPIRGQKIDAAGLLHNDLEDPAFRLYPDIKKTKEEMTFLLKSDVVMTGSGASLFALYHDRGAAEKGFNLLSDKWSESSTKVFLSSFH